MKEPKPREYSFAKTHDYIYAYRGYHTPDAICRIRIYEHPTDVPIVIASELPDNPNTSVTNMAEYLAAEIIAKHFPHRFEEMQPIRWIEHYPPIEAYGRRGKTHDYSLVDFSSYRPRLVGRFGGPRLSIGRPSWRHIDEEEIERVLGQKPM